MSFYSNRFLREKCLRKQHKIAQVMWIDYIV